MKVGGRALCPYSLWLNMHKFFLGLHWGWRSRRGFHQGALSQNLEQEGHLHGLQGERRPLKLCKVDLVSPSSNTVLDLGWGILGNVREGGATEGSRRTDMLSGKMCGTVGKAQSGRS